MNKNSFITAISAFTFGLAGAFIGNTIVSVNALADSDIKDNIKAKSFSVVDDNGKVRGGLRADKDVSMLFLTNSQGKMVASMQTMDNNTSLFMKNNKGNTIVDLNVDNETSDAFLQFYPENSTQMIDILDKKTNKITKHKIKVAKLSLSSMTNSKNGQIMISDKEDSPSVLISGSGRKELGGTISLMRGNKLTWNAPD
ncbi:MAG: hypothetical protein U0354_08875 [Candidatus Sericytochromatia bacterium]